MISSKLVQSLFIYVALAACISIILVWSVSYPQSREAQAQIPISPRQCFLLQIQYSDEDIRYQKPKVQCISICSWYHNILDLRLSFFIYVYLLTFEFLYLCVCVLVYLCTVWWRGIPSTQLQVISWKLQLVIGFGGEGTSRRFGDRLSCTFQKQKEDVEPRKIFINTSSWLDFVLHALWALKYCDPCR